MIGPLLIAIRGKKQKKNAIVKVKTGIDLAPRYFTFLALVEHWRTRMVHAVFLRIGEGLPTSLVDALAGHSV